MNLFVCYDKCSTCKKAHAWLDEQGVTYTARPIKEQDPTAAELADWTAKSGLARGKFVNTSGQLYRQMQLKDKLPALSDEEFFALLATDGMLVKRPVLVTEKGVCPGFKPDRWAELLGL